MLAPDDPLPSGGPARASWLHVVIGGLMLLGFGALAALSVSEQHGVRAATVETTVTAAVRKLQTGEIALHARLTDLVLDCDRRQLHNDEIVTHARGADTSGPTILVALEPDDTCVSGPAAHLVGTLEHSALDDRRDVRRVPDHILYPHHPATAAIVVCSLLAAIGLLVLVHGLREGSRAPARPPGPIAPPTHDAPPASARWLLPGPLLLDEPTLRRGRRRGVVLTAVAVALAGVTFAYFAAFVRDALATSAAWSHGADATHVEVAVHDARNRIFKRADLLLTYTDVAGQRHHGGFSRWGLDAMRERGTPVVRHDRADPGVFAVSWRIDGLAGEIAARLLFTVLGCLFAGLLARDGVRQRRHERRLRAVLHAGPEEVALAVLATARREHKGEPIGTTYTLQVPDGATFTIDMHRDEHPLFLDLDSSKILGLCRPGDRSFAVVLRENLAPLLATDAASNVRDRWRARMNPGLATALDRPRTQRRRP